METKVSVTNILALVEAFKESCVNSNVAPFLSATFFASSTISESISIPGGVEILTLIPNFRHAMHISFMTLLASPIHAIFNFELIPLFTSSRDILKFSIIVKRSQIACKGWNLSHRELMIGTEESLQKASMSSCLFTRAKIHETIDDTTLVVS
uniref:J0925 protein n=1 Tax=Saccharomyces cerevisiae TaxID=4932 RepID=E9PA69_YEASX|nr:J0925 [Saccharomyces cerevisiae]